MLSVRYKYENYANLVKHCDDGVRLMGRLRKTWWDCVKNMKSLGLFQEDLSNW